MTFEDSQRHPPIDDGVQAVRREFDEIEVKSPLQRDRKFGKSSR